MIYDYIQTKFKMYNYISSVMQYMINNYLVNDWKSSVILDLVF